MNPKTQRLFKRITETIVKEPDRPPEHIIQAILLTARQEQLNNDEVRWILDRVRYEFGKTEKAWAAMVVAVIRSIPLELGGKGEGMS